MREHRWETQRPLTFDQALDVSRRLSEFGLKPVRPEQEVICYLEEWEIAEPSILNRLDPWPTEDVTLIHLLNHWTGDFFLLAGGYHTIFQRYRSVNTYCSLAHPWRLDGHFATLLAEAMFWVGFRHRHSFIRVRLETAEIVAPGEAWADHQRPMWLEERQSAFEAAIGTLDLPLEAAIEGDRLVLRTSRPDTPLFCSWPDAFGPCQFELNSSDPFEFLVPASQLAETVRGRPVDIRAYLTGFTEAEWNAFQNLNPRQRTVCRCSAHCVLQELPELVTVIGSTGRLYTTLCELQTQALLPRERDASMIIGIVATSGEYFLEIRLSHCPLDRSETTSWLESLLGLPLGYAPLPAFP